MSDEAGRAGVHSIDHFALQVNDVAEAARFYESFGLTVGRVGDALALKAVGSEHVWARIVAGAGRRLAWLSFGCFERDYRVLIRQLEALGAARCSAPIEAESGGSWYEDPDGNVLQIKVGPKVTPTRRREPQLVPHGLRDVAGGRRGAPRIRPARLSHVLLFSPDVARQAAFYTAALGLNVADTSLDIIAFMHAIHGSDHHLIAFAKSDRPGWHHASWDVPSFEEVGLGAMQMRAAGYARGWGTGRHVLGSNYFHYVQDPWGSFCEYAAGIDFVAAGTTWPGGEHDPGDALYYWGPDMPDYFLANTDSAARRSTRSDA